jgi:hypothetical protein
MQITDYELNGPYLLGHDHHHQLMYGSAQQKGDEHSARLGQLVTPHRRRVHMPKQELVHRLIPLARELIP